MKATISTTYFDSEAKESFGVSATLEWPDSHSYLGHTITERIRHILTEHKQAMTTVVKEDDGSYTLYTHNGLTLTREIINDLTVLVERIEAKRLPEPVLAIA